MSDNNYVYQAMFLLDNGEVREQGFNAVREWVKSTLEKHGATVKVLRLWGERPLTYPIQGRARATYLLGWIEGGEKTVAKVKHEMYLLGPCFRSLFLQEDAIPAEELALGIEEIRDEDVTVQDDTPVVEALFEDDDESEDGSRDTESRSGGDDEDSDDDADESEKKEAKPAKSAAAASGDDQKKEEA